MQLSLFPKQGCVGLDIGHNSIKAVQVERSGEGWVVQKAAEAPTPPDSVKDGVVIDQAAMTDAIRAIPTADYPTAAARPLNSRLDTSRLQRAFGLRMPPWQQGVERMLAEVLGGGA